MKKQYFCGRAVLFVALTVGLLVPIAQGSQPEERKQLTVKCYWQNFAEVISSSLDKRVAKTGCERYKDSTHCERTASEMLADAIGGKRDWERVIANGLIYTVSCKRHCKKILGPESTYDVEIDGKFMWVTIEMPDNKNLVETFQIFDISAAKEENNQ